MERAVVVTGGSRGVGRGIVLRLAAEGVHVVVLDAEPPTEPWPADVAERVEVVVGSAAELSVAERAADRAEAAGSLVGWVNNAALFRDATLDDPTRVVEVITTNVTLAVVGCSVAVGRFVAAGTRARSSTCPATRRSAPCAGPSRMRRPRLRSRASPGRPRWTTGRTGSA